MTTAALIAAAVLLVATLAYWARELHLRSHGPEARRASELPGEVPASVAAVWEFDQDEIAQEDRTTRHAWERGRREP